MMHDDSPDHKRVAMGAVLESYERLRRQYDWIVVEGAGRLASQRVVVPAVPRTAQQPVLDRALAERAALVRAFVGESAITSLVAA